MIEPITYKPKEFLVDRELVFDENGNLKGTALDLVKQLVDRHKPLVDHYNMLEGMYLGTAQQIHNRTVGSGANNKAVVNYPKKLADTITGFNVGNPVNYEFEEKEQFKDYIENMYEREENSALWLQSMIFGHTFELVYTSKNKDKDFDVSYTYLKPQECIMVYDTTPRQNKLCAVVISSVASIDGKNDKEIYTLYTNKVTYKIDADEKVEVIPNATGEIAITEWCANDYRMSLFEVVGSITEAYNQAFNDKLNSSEYFTDPIFKAINAPLKQLDLAIKNATEQYQFEIQQFEQDKAKAEKNGIPFKKDYPVVPKIILSMQDIKTFYSPNNENERTVDVGFIEKPVNDTLQENLLERIKKEIFNISGIPDLNREDFGNRSGTSMTYETLSMETMSTVTQMKFNACFEERINLINTMVNVTKNVAPIKDIKVKFTNVLPKNNLEIAQFLQTLASMYEKDVIYDIAERHGIYDAELAKKAREEAWKDDFTNLLGNARAGENENNNEISRANTRNDKKGTGAATKQDTTGDK